MMHFDAISHTYTVDGVVLPSVTQIIAPLYNFSTVSEDVLKRAGNFGTAVHLCCELHDQNDLDESTLDPAIVPYLDGWKWFLRLSRAKPILIEQRYASKMHFAGTIDRLCEIEGKLVLVDIKTSAALTPATGVQLAAYKHLLIENGFGVDARAAVQLKADGNYKYQIYSDQHDWPTFVSLLTIHNWRKKHEQ